MKSRAIFLGLCRVTAIGLAASLPTVAYAQEMQPSGIREIQEILREKSGRTPTQRKLESHLHLAGQVARGVLSAKEMPALANVAKLLKFDEKGRVHVDVRGTVSKGLLAEFAALGGTVESSQVEYSAIRGWIPLLKAEALARRNDVTFIEPAAMAILNEQLSARPRRAQVRLLPAQHRENLRRQLATALPGFEAERSPVPPQFGILNTAPINTKGLVSEGANLVHAQGITGDGVKVGVLSDGVDSLASMQAAGNLPANVTVLSGQAGTGDEGTAMLEIVYDLAPGAELYFATANGGPAQMATNIEGLAVAGCSIIVDDVTYFNEGVFQDGIIAQEVNAVAANGVLYFSSAANSGNADSGTSGTWEGDFDGTGATIPPINTGEGKVVTVHAFDATHNYDQVTARSSGASPTLLQWSDPLGASCNDYDLFNMDSTLTTILDASTSAQSCTQDPIEAINAPYTNDVLVIVLYDGTARALHLDTERGRLAINTAGATFGHNAAGSAVTVAATPAQSSIFTAGNQSPETYSSDGPRKIFYHPLGTPITDDNFLFGTGGGTTLSKVDLTAADCGQSAVPGFNPFCGTSAAAPTAAAIAALVMSAAPSLTPSEVLSLMKSTALAPHSGFNSRTVGAGIAMANLSVNSVLVPAASFSPTSIFFGTEPVGTNSLPRTVTLTNTGNVSLSIYSHTIAGANFGDFIVTSSCLATLAAGDSCTFSINLHPTAAGPRKSALIVSHSAPNSPQRILLTGVGTGATVSPAALAFASRTVGTSSSPMNATITNNGSVTMHIWQIAITGANAGDFLKTTTCGATLAIGLGCTVSVTFKPTAVGARTASLLFSDDGAGSPQAVMLKGGGLNTVITIGPGHAVSGNLSPSAPAGHCNYNAPSDRYLLDLSGQNSPTVVTVLMTSTAFDTFVCVLDASNGLLAQDDDSGGGINSSATLSLAPAQYYIEASSFSGAGSGSYTLSALVASIMTPGTVSLGNRVVASLSPSAASGVCNGGDPADRWTFSIGSTKTLTIDASSLAFDTTLCLLDSSNNPVGYPFDNFDSDSGPDTNARLIEQGLTVGTYYIEVSSESPSFTGGAYTLSLQSGLPPGMPISVGQSPSGNLSATLAAKGVCNGGKPADRWTFTLGTTTTLTIDASSVAFDTTLCLLNSSNSPVGFPFDNFDSDSGPGTNAQLVESSLPVGTYYIEVSSENPSFTGGAYTLALSSSGGASLTGFGGMPTPGTTLDSTHSENSDEPRPAPLRARKKTTTPRRTAR